MASPQVRAAALALFASALLSLIDNFVAQIAEEAAFWQFQLVRTLMAGSLLLIFARVTGRTLRPNNFWKTVLRSLTVSMGLLIYFATLGMLPVAQAGAGLFSAPIWVLFFSALFFSVRITLFQIFCILCGFVGVLMLLQPDPDTLSILSLLPLVAGVFYGLGMLLTPHLCGNESPVTLAIGIFTTIGMVSLIMLLYFSLFPAPEPSYLTGGWVAPSARFLWLTAFQAVGAVIAVPCIVEAYRIGNPAHVAMFEYSFLIFACVWAFVLWDLTTNPLALLGIAVILVSGAALTLKGERADIGRQWEDAKGS